MKIGILIYGLLVLALVSYGQEVVMGKIVDAETKAGIKDVDVSIKGTTIATKTNVSGYFQLTLDSLRDLIISSPEYDTGYVTLARGLNRFQASLLKRKPKVSGDDEPTFVIVEEQPEFPGGMAALAAYLYKNLKYPKDAERLGINGKVFVQFIVDKDGTIPPDEIKVVKGLSASCNAEAVRLVSQFPTWKPGYQNHKPVKARFILPIKFGF